MLNNFPQPGRSYAEIAQIVHQLPTTLESMLDSGFVINKLLDNRANLLRISPFLLFNVLLRQTIDSKRNAMERRVINYLANLLSLFVKTERVYRIEPQDQKTYEYLVDLIEASTLTDARRQFLVYAHVGNYSLYLTGLFPSWIDYRYRFKKRPVTADYYSELGRSYFHQASLHPLAKEYRLDEVFLRLALMFDDYKKALNRLSDDYMGKK